MRALVTGASRGIGSETARSLARDGFELALHYRTGEREAAELARELGGSGSPPFTLGADLGDARSIERLGADLARRWDRLDVLVQNAGSYPRGKIDEFSDPEVEETLAVNLLGPIRLVRALLPLLRRSDSGRIVFVSSILAYSGSTHGAPYASAKAGLIGLARSLARELAPRITVNVVAPGPTDTAILAGDTPERRRQRETEIPMGRIAAAREVAEAIRFLVSPQAAQITGTTIHVNGGLYFG